VLLYGLREVTREGLAVAREPTVVAGAQLDDEGIGSERGVAGEDLRGVVEFAFERGAELDRLHLGAEDAREGRVDEALEGAFETRDEAHETSSCAGSGCAGRSCNGPAGSRWHGSRHARADGFDELNERARSMVSPSSGAARG
jgi:hypothetical protein